MSSIYVSEPPTSGKVIIETTVGPIEVELWCKEAPKACRNFIQLALEGYYDGTIFHRVVPGWIVQGGDPTGTGEGGESIYGAPFADEFHSRLRFNRRGLLAMANAGPNDNGSQFFITLSQTPELQKKHTIFGTAVGDSLFSALKLGEGEVDTETERPTYPKSIKHIQVLDSPFDDIVPRVTIDSRKEDNGGKRRKVKAIKNKTLLSFGGDDDDDSNDDDDVITTKQKRGSSKSGFPEKKEGTKSRSKMISSHDILDDDPALGKEAAYQIPAKDSKESESDKTKYSPARYNEENESNKTKDSPAKPTKRTSALSDLISQYKDNNKPKSKRSREDDLFARLESFRSKIKKQ